MSNFHYHVSMLLEYVLTVYVSAADERILMMSDMYNLLIAKAPLCFPPPTSTTKCGFNFNLLEDIVCGTQARLCLYLLTPDTGEYIQ